MQVDLRNGEQFSPAFRAINPDCTVPALALDDGTVIADAVAICGYLEELHPEPPLIGTTPQERAMVTALNRQIERDGFFAAMDAFRNTAKGLKGRALPGRTTMSRSRSSPRAAASASSISSVPWTRASPSASSWPDPFHHCGYFHAGADRLCRAGQAVFPEDARTCVAGTRRSRRGQVVRRYSEYRNL